MISLQNSLWVERLTLTNFRSYVSATIETDAGPQVITGANGSGKTNLLEALSLLSPGQGLRRVIRAPRWLAARLMRGSTIANSPQRAA